MEHSDTSTSNSSSENRGEPASSPRSMLRHHLQLKREREKAAEQAESTPTPQQSGNRDSGPLRENPRDRMVSDADISPAASCEKKGPSRLNSALAKANDSHQRLERSESPSPSNSDSSTPVPQPPASQPFASQPPASKPPASKPPASKPPASKIREKGEVTEKASDVRGESSGYLDLLLDFRRFADGVHPLKGWGEAFLLVLVSGLAWSQIALPLFIPDHPGPLPLTGNLGALILFFFQDMAMGVLGWLLMGMIIHGLYFACGGRPPLLWTLKVLVYALLPYTLTRIAFILYGFHSGSEAYIRGYRPDWVLHYAPLFYIVLFAWAAVRLALATRSKHCQGYFKIGIVLFMILPGLSLAWILAGTEIRTVFHGRKLMAHWEEAQESWVSQNPRDGLATLNLLGAIPFGMDVKMKSEFYLMRGELRMLTGNVLGAREDFLSLSHLMPVDHSHHRLARGANLLLLGRTDLGRPHLERAMEMLPNSADVQRWLAWYHLGRFSEEEEKNLGLAETHARRALSMAPNALHQQLLLEVFFAQNRHQEMLTQVEKWPEIKKYRVEVLHMLSEAALALGREPESRVWNNRADARAAER